VPCSGSVSSFTEKYTLKVNLGALSCGAFCPKSVSLCTHNEVVSVVFVLVKLAFSIYPFLSTVVTLTPTELFGGTGEGAVGGSTTVIL
jgi:hypothetical protein